MRRLPPAAARARRRASSGDFYGYAHSWCSTVREERQRTLLTVDPHSPPRYRVDGPLSNTPEFAAAFGCAAGSKMVRAPRCEVW